MLLAVDDDDVEHAQADESARCNLTDDVDIEHVELDQHVRCDLASDDDGDLVRIVAWTPLAPRWAPTVEISSNLDETGVPSG